MKIKMHSQYDHFPNHNPLEGEKFIHCYNDGMINIPIEQNSIALMIEPRPLQQGNYDRLLSDYSKYKYVFTHDSRLLETIPNAKLLLYGYVWDWSDIDNYNNKNFTHPVSMVSSDKEMCPLHVSRKRLAKELESYKMVDCYGTFNGGIRADTKTIYGSYPFSIAIENYVDDYWFTEKICNCFSNCTVPIYVGARKIDKFFNPKGIIQVDNIKHIPYLLETMDFEQEYYLRLDAIKENWSRVSRFDSFEKWFFNTYEGLLEEMV